MLVPTNNKDFLKDTETGALVNQNPGALQEHKKKIEQFKSIDNMKSEINTMKDDISSIKTMLELILKKV